MSNHEVPSLYKVLLSSWDSKSSMHKAGKELECTVHNTGRIKPPEHEAVLPSEIRQHEVYRLGYQYFQWEGWRRAWWERSP